MTTIYALLQPGTKEIRYVGKCVDARNRLLRHLRDRRPSHKTNWVQKLQSQGLIPILQVLEVCDPNRWQEREMFWIAKLRAEGARLTNMNDGGFGGINPTPEVRNKISKARLGKPGISPSERTRMLTSVRWKGVKKTEDHRRKIGDGNRRRQWTPESRLRLSESHKALWDDKRKSRQSKAIVQWMEDKVFCVETNEIYESKKKLSALIAVPYHQVIYNIKVGKAIGRFHYQLLPVPEKL